MPKLREGIFFLQWHITARCEQACEHCYIYDSPTYSSEIRNELVFEDCTKIIDDLVMNTNRWALIPRIHFTGGDPLLREDFWALLDYTNSLDVQVGVLGNPYQITHRTAKKLVKHQVGYYQISIDGKERVHDSFRRPGSYAESLHALDILREARIQAHVMFTLCRQNADDLLDVIRIVAEREVDLFTFDLMIPVGKARNMKEAMLSATELRALLLQVEDLWDELSAKGTKTCFGKKFSYWKLLAYDQRIIDNSVLDYWNKKGMIVGGCAAGSLFLTVIADGTVFPCRRLPIAIGRLPEESIEEIINRSELLQQLRNPMNYEKCKECELRSACRGCPAAAYACSGNPFAPDPYCWNDLEKNVTHDQ